MTKTLALTLSIALLLGVGCSSVVTIDRTKIEDDLYTPTDAGNAGAGAGGAGAGGAGAGAGTSGAGDDDAGAAGAAGGG